MIKVLLVAPTDPEKPKNLKLLVGGENTYTQTLLSNPPKGVSYTYHMDALKKGIISYSPIHYFLKNLVKFRILPLSAGTEAIRINSDFDLVHCHGYSVKIVGKKKIQVVISDSSSNYLFLRDYVHWSEWRIKTGYFMRRWLFRFLGVVDCDTNWQGAKKVIVFSQFAMKIHLQLGVPKSKMVVIQPGLTSVIPAKAGIYKQPRDWIPHPFDFAQGLRQVRDDKIINILFVGIWFERKGGPLLLEAFKKLSGKYSNIKLTIVGPIGDRIKNYESRIKNKIKNYDFVPREKLMREIFPKADIFVLIPPVAEGFGFVLLEAASFGIPAVATSVYALGEIVEDGKTGFVIEPNNLDQMIEKLEILIKNSKLRAKMGREARKRFDRRFDNRVTNNKLLEIYKGVVKL